MAPRQRRLSNEEILKFLSELSENETCNESTSDDDEHFDINDKKSFVKNAYKIPSSESMSGDSENIPNKCSGGSHKTPLNRKCAKKMQKQKRMKYQRKIGNKLPFQSDLKEAKRWKYMENTAAVFIFSCSTIYSKYSCSRSSGHKCMCGL